MYPSASVTLLCQDTWAHPLPVQGPRALLPLQVRNCGPGCIPVSLTLLQDPTRTNLLGVKGGHWGAAPGF